jgi:hypothetical protein
MCITTAHPPHDAHTRRPKMIRTFSLSALFFLSIGLLLASYAQLPIAA